MWKGRRYDLSDGRRIRLCVSHKVNLFGRLNIPKVDCEHEESGIERVDVYLPLCICVHDYEPDAWWWRDGPSVLVSKTTHARSNWLLHDIQGPDLAIVYPCFGERGEIITVICLVEIVLLWTGRDRILLQRHVVRAQGL